MAKIVGEERRGRGPATRVRSLTTNGGDRRAARSSAAAAPRAIQGVRPEPVVSGPLPRSASYQRTSAVYPPREAGSRRATGPPFATGRTEEGEQRFIAHGVRAPPTTRGLAGVRRALISESASLRLRRVVAKRYLVAHLFRTCRDFRLRPVARLSLGELARSPLRRCKKPKESRHVRYRFRHHPHVTTGFFDV